MNVRGRLACSRVACGAPLTGCELKLDWLTRNGLVETAFQFTGAGPAIHPGPKPCFQMPHTIRAVSNGLIDVGIGDGVADANVHKNRL